MLLSSQVEGSKVFAAFLLGKDGWPFLSGAVIISEGFPMTSIGFTSDSSLMVSLPELQLRFRQGTWRRLRLAVRDLH